MCEAGDRRDRWFSQQIRFGQRFRPLAAVQGEYHRNGLTVEFRQIDHRAQAGSPKPGIAETVSATAAFAVLVDQCGGELLKFVSIEFGMAYRRRIGGTAT